MEVGMRRGIVLLLVVGLLAACGPGGWANRLPYAGPVERTIAPGEFLPGTPIRYLGQAADGARLSIEGREKIKAVGDPVDWREDVIAGVNLDQTYRVAQIGAESLYLAGTVRVIVQNAVPRPGAAKRDAPIHFRFPVGYHVEPGQVIPGTTWTFLAAGEQGAELGDQAGSSYHPLNDPISWEGMLGSGIWLALEVRPTLISDERLDVVGTADLWIQP